MLKVVVENFVVLSKSPNYELRAWTDENIQWKKLKSEPAVAVYNAIHAPGMLFLFPQYEVRMFKDKE